MEQRQIVICFQRLLKGHYIFLKKLALPGLYLFIFVSPTNNFYSYRALVVAQLVEWSLPIPEVRNSNPVIGKNLFIH